MLNSRARLDPQRPILVTERNVCSYGEAIDRIDAISTGLSQRGVVHGDRVAIMSANSDAYILLLIAIARLGAIAVPVNPELNEREATYILGHAGVSVVACSRECLPTIGAASRGLPTAPLLLLFDGNMESDSTVAFQELLETSKSTGFADVRPDDTWLMVYTSGTTGFPKGVMHSQRNFVLAGEAFVERMYLQPADRLFVVLPLFHINALFYSLGGALAAGASLLLVPRFSASSFWRAAAEGGATEVNIIGAIGNILLRRPRSEFRPDHQLRKLYGAGMSAEILDAFPVEFGVPTLVEGYGLTEVPGVCNSPFLGPHKNGSMGRPARHPDHSRTFSEMRIVDDSGNCLAADEIGEIAVRSPIAMQGYYRDEKATAAAFHEGWFLTGDLGYRDADEYYYFVSRKKDIIRRRGENVSGAEIDRVVSSHPKVLEAAAIGVPSELGDDEILIAVVPRAGHVIDPEEISEWCAPQLAPYKRPRYFAQLESLPHTPTHRIAKFKLKEDLSLRERAVELRNGR
jgi:crotonobetaine/carnitine-CoA ligase